MISEHRAAVSPAKGSTMPAPRIRIDPSIAVSLLAVGLFLGVFGMPARFARSLATLIEIAWLYLTNTRG